jgi:predicted acetyltransferase
MADFTVRLIQDAELRETHNLSTRAFLESVPDDKKWERIRESYRKYRRFVAVQQTADHTTEVIGTTSAFETKLSVPGGALVPTSAISWATVRADQTRRGVLRAVLGEQLKDSAQRGHVMAYLHASEATIYERFGFGIATFQQNAYVSVHKGSTRNESNSVDGELRLLTPAQASKQIPTLYREIGLYRSGMIERPDLWWQERHERLFDDDSALAAATYHGINGDKGYAIYQPSSSSPEQGDALDIDDLQVSSPQALAAIWNYLRRVDLVSEVRFYGRPVDDLLPLMLVDYRAYQVNSQRDDAWLRILDVLTALRKRSYQNGKAVTFAVEDPLFPTNSGCYRVSAEGADRTDQPAELKLTMDTLAMIYLGTWRPSELVEAGRIEELSPSAAQRLDVLFHTPQQPWCGTFF